MLWNACSKRFGLLPFVRHTCGITSEIMMTREFGYFDNYFPLLRATPSSPLANENENRSSVKSCHVCVPYFADDMETESLTSATSHERIPNTASPSTSTGILGTGKNIV